MPSSSPIYSRVAQGSEDRTSDLNGATDDSHNEPSSLRKGAAAGRVVRRPTTSEASQLEAGDAMIPRVGGAQRGVDRIFPARDRTRHNDPDEPDGPVPLKLPYRSGSIFGHDGSMNAKSDSHNGPAATSVVPLSFREVRFANHYLENGNAAAVPTSDYGTK